MSQSSPPPKSKSRIRKTETTGTTRIMEVHASTRSYPHWWTDVEESRVLRRRKSSTDAVLERNLCFVDTPGHNKSALSTDDSSMVVDYVESLLHRNVETGAMDDNELLGVLSGSGGVQVDLVLYLLPPGK